MGRHPGSIVLPLGWEYPEPDEAAARHAELKRELPSGHILFGIPVETFASRIGDDDTLFRHLGDPDRFTLVHLTWLGREEINAEHPSVDFDGTLAEFLTREQNPVADRAVRRE
jgi:hypothetical protein